MQLIHVGIQAGRGGGDERKSHFYFGEHLRLRHPEGHLWGQNLGAEGRGQAVGCRVICDPPGIRRNKGLSGAPRGHKERGRGP